MIQILSSRAQSLIRCYRLVERLLFLQKEALLNIDVIFLLGLLKAATVKSDGECTHFWETDLENMKENCEDLNILQREDY